VSSTGDQLRVLLDDTTFRALESLARSSAPVSGRALARALTMSPTTATSALALLSRAGFVTSTVAGRATLWSLNEDNLTMRSWLAETSGSSRSEAGGKPGPRPRMTVVIFTALLLEYAAVVAHLTDLRATRVNATRFEEGRFAGDAVDWTVYVAELGEGNIPTAIEFTSAATMLDPDLVLFVGVAASVKPKDLCQGDVIVANRVYGIHSGKDARTVEDESINLARPLSFPAAHRTVQLAKAVRRRDWLSELSVTKPRNADGAAPRVEIRPIAAGDVVHADARSSLMDKVRTHFNDAAAVDMESLGLYEAAHRDDSRPALAVRGISDCVEDKTPDADRKWQPRAASHAAAFAFALLRWAEPEDLSAQTARAGHDTDTTSQGTPSPAELLLHLPPPVAVAYDWAHAIAGAEATAALREFAALDGQPATWLSRFRHRPPPLFRSDRAKSLWVLAAQFAGSHEHPVAAWLFEQAADRWHGDTMAGYLYCQAAVAVSRSGDPATVERLLDRAEEAVPAGRPLWALFRAALGGDSDATATAILAVIDALDLPFSQAVLWGLGDASPVTPGDEFVAFVEEFVEAHPPFLEQARMTVTLAAASLLRDKPDGIEAAQTLLEQAAESFPPYRHGPATMPPASPRGSRSSNVLLEWARTLYVRAVDPWGRESSFDRDAALTTAVKLALTARDRRLDWGGPTGDALAVAAQSRAAFGDIPGALRLLVPPPAGTANSAETSAQPVVQLAAALATQAGNTALALDLAAKIDDIIERHLATAFALARREDSHAEAATEFRCALDSPSAGTDQQIRAFVGLSSVQELTDGELGRLTELDAETADVVRAQSLLTAGKTNQALILARRYPHSDAALQIRVGCLLNEGKTTDAITAMETFAERHHHDEHHRLGAAALAVTSGLNHDAVRLAGPLAASSNALRRKSAREILIDAASRSEDWNEILTHTQRLIDDESLDDADATRQTNLTRYRWARAHALHQLRRMNDAYTVIREHPRLVPADLNQARLMASVLRTIAPSVTEANRSGIGAPGAVTQKEVLAAITETAQAFPHDEELVATAVMTAFAMPVAETIDYSLMTQARELHHQFFENFPDSKLIQAVPLGENAATLVDFLRNQFAPMADAASQLRRAAFVGQIPFGACVAATGNGYAESLIRNPVGAYVIRSTDDRITAREVDAARHARNGTVVVDTSALLLSPHVLAPATELREHFEQIYVAAAQRDDILHAHSSLMMRSSGWLGWDAESQRPTFMEFDKTVTERWATAADALAQSLAWCDVLADPFPDDADPRLRGWSSSLHLARERGASLVADDAALRALAHNEGIPAFGSLQLLTALIEDGLLPPGTIEEAYRNLREIRAADLPVLDQFHEIAATEDWNPSGYAGLLLTRPSTWLPITQGWNHYTALIKAIPDKTPQLVATWCATAIYGLCLVSPPPAVPTVSATLVAWTLLELQQADALPLLLASAEQKVRQFVGDVDMLKEVVQHLVMTARQAVPSEKVGTIVLPLLSGLEKEPHAKAIEYFFTMP
jgi:nucleoside phosphorylase